MTYLRREKLLPLVKPMIGKNEIAEVVDSLKSGWITTGPKTIKFEEMLSAYNNVSYCLVMNSATTAQEIAMQLLNLAPGDEVITTSMTWVSTLNTIVLQGGIPVLVDIDPITLNIDPTKIEAAVTSRTRGIIPVHLAGLPVSMNPIWDIAGKYNLWVVEDAAQAMGAKYHDKKIGSDPRSIFSIYSFQANKNITTGEGGALVIHNERFVDKVKQLRFHGINRETPKYFNEYTKVPVDVIEPARKANFMDIQAAIGIHQLKELDSFNTRRRYLFHRYIELMKDVEEITLPTTGDSEHGHCYHLFAIRINAKKAKIDRDTFMLRLREENISTGIHYRPVHTQSFYQSYYSNKHHHAIPKDGLPHTELIGNNILSLPLWPGLTELDQNQVIAAILHTLAKAKNQK